MSIAGSLPNAWFISILTIGFLCLVLLGFFVWITIRNKRKVKKLEVKQKTVQEEKVVNTNRIPIRGDSSESRTTLARLVKTKSLSLRSIWKDTETNVSSSSTHQDDQIEEPRSGAGLFVPGSNNNSLSRRSKIVSMDFDWLRRQFSTLRSPSSSPALSQVTPPSPVVTNLTSPTVLKEDNVISVSPIPEETALPSVNQPQETNKDDIVVIQVDSSSS